MPKTTTDPAVDALAGCIMMSTLADDYSIEADEALTLAHHLANRGYALQNDSHYESMWRTMTERVERLERWAQGNAVTW